MKTETERFTEALIDAILWVEGLEDAVPHPSLERAVAKVSERFLSLTEEIRTEATLRRYATDLWLTVCGHGAGFWDGDYPEHERELMEAANDAEVRRHLYSRMAYKGDDGYAYLFGAEDV